MDALYVYDTYYKLLSYSTLHYYSYNIFFISFSYSSIKFQPNSPDSFYVALIPPHIYSHTYTLALIYIYTYTYTHIYNAHILH